MLSARNNLIKFEFEMLNNFFELKIRYILVKCYIYLVVLSILSFIMMCYFAML